MQSGKISHFGGIADKTDRLNNLAFVRMHGTPLETVQYYQNTPFKNLFVSLLKAHTINRDFPNYGLSAYLNIEYPYYAERFPGKKKYIPDTPVKVFSDGKKSIMALLIDFGPAKWTGKTYDVSPGIYNYFNKPWNKKIFSRTASPEEKELFFSGKYRLSGNAVFIKEDNDIITPVIFTGLGFLIMKGLKNDSSRKD